MPNVSQLKDPNKPTNSESAQDGFGIRDPQGEKV